VVFGLMKSGVPVEEFAERLLGADLSLMSLPKDLRLRMLQTY
jgi:hypothetical protein